MHFDSAQCPINRCISLTNTGTKSECTVPDNEGKFGLHNNSQNNKIESPKLFKIRSVMPYILHNYML